MKGNESPENFEHLYDTAPCGFLNFCANGTITNTNQTLLKWLGRERGEVVSVKRFQDFIPVGERIFFETHVAPLLKMQGFAEEINFHLVTAEGARLPVLTSIKMSKVDGNEVYRMALFNISDRKKYENELMYERNRAEAAARAKADVLAMLAHEIRTPLNAIVGASNLLTATQLTSEQSEFSEMLKSSSANLMELLNSILELSKLESGKARIESRAFAIRPFADGIIRNWKGLAKSKSLEIFDNIGDDVPENVLGDPVKLTQILSNLMGNALKFTREGHVCLNISLIKLKPPLAILRFEVEDSGIGIAPDHLRQIFEEFQQADYETASKFGGTGLGLTISQKIAKLHGSDIQVQSKVGCGSKFSVDLKFEIVPKLMAKSQQMTIQDGAELSGLRVLIVDDRDENIILLGHFFKIWGVDFEIAKDGKLAVEKTLSQKFDVVLMDLQMPVLNGYEAAAAIRKSTSELKDTPIIAFSGSTTNSEQNSASSSAFSDVLGKPFHPNELIKKLKRFLPEPHS